MKIKLILNELKKIFKLRNVIVAAAMFITIGTFLGFFSDFVSLPGSFSSQGVSSSAVSIRFSDMLLQKYGESIDLSELPQVKADFEIVSQDVIAAAEKSEYLKRTGSTLTEDFNLKTNGYSDAESPEERQYSYEITYGNRCLEGAKYPLYFARSLQEIIGYFEAAEKSGMKGDISYDIMNTTFTNSIDDNLYIPLLIIIMSLFIIVPYMVEENKSRIAFIEYSSKAGRSSYTNKLIAVVIAMIIMVGTGAGAAVVNFLRWDISKYYGCKIDTLKITHFIEDVYVPSDYNLPLISSKCYSGLTLLELYILLLLGVSLCGILTLLLTAVISYHFDNIFAPFAIGLLLLSIPIAFYERAVITGLNLTSMFNDGSKMLTTKYEPFIFIAVLIAVTVATAVIEIRKKKKAEI